MLSGPTRATTACASLLLVLALTATAPAGAVDSHLDADAIDRAIVFARTATRDDRRAFHDAYLRTPGDAVRRISLVSEYRRVVLLVEEKMRLLDRNYGVRQMTEALTPWRGLLEVIVELQFHPQNTYVGVPLIDVLLVPLDDAGRPLPLVAEATDRRPRFGLFWDSAADGRAVVALPPALGAGHHRQRTADRRLGTRPLRRHAARPRPL